MEMCNYKNNIGTILKLLILAGFLFKGIGSFAQDDIYLHWDSEVGCLQYDGSQENWGIEVDQIEDDQCIKVCEGSTVNFTIYDLDSIGRKSIDGVLWYADGGNINQNDFYTSGDTLATAEVTWPSPKEDGSITVEFIGEEMFTLTLCVIVKPKPEANFEVLTEENEFYCNHTDIYFDNLSKTFDGSQIISNVWDFGDGNTSHAKEPVHSYMNPGVYQVTLTVYDECNCSNTYTKTITVLEPSYEISCPTVTCEGSLETYFLESPFDEQISCSDFPWQVDGGHIVQNGNNLVQILWDDVDADGFGYIYFDQGSCNIECNNIIAVKIPVITEEGTIKGGKKSLCKGEQSRYTLPQWPTTDFNWTVYNQSNGSQFNAAAYLVDQRNEVVVNTGGLPPGKYVLRCDYVNTLLSCGGIAEYEFEVFEPLEIDASLDDACEGDNVFFGLTNSNLTAGPHWTIYNKTGDLVNSVYGDHMDFSFSEKGTYKIVVEAPGYCKDVTTIQIYEIPSITQASIEGPDEICPGSVEEYIFKGTSGYDVEWEVDYGSFSTSQTGDTVNIRFDENYSNFQVSAYLVNHDCISDEVTKTVDKYMPDVDIYSKEYDTSNGPVGFCTSSESDFELQGEFESDTYEWFIEPPELANVSDRQGTNDVTIMFNEKYNGQNQGTIYVKARVCGKLEVVDSLDFELEEIAKLTVTNIPNSICANEDFDIVISSDRNLNLTDPQSDMKLSFDNGQVFVGGVQTSPTSFTFEDIYLNNLNPGQTNTNINYTIEITSNCGRSIVHGSIMEIPSPIIDLSIKDGGSVYCYPNTIGTVLEASVQGNYNQSSFIWYHDGSPISGVTGPILDLSSWSQDFGEYKVSVSNSDGCTTMSNVVNIIQDCPFPNQGSGNSCDPPEDGTLNAQWEDCSTLKLTGSYSTNGGANPIDFLWGFDSDFTAKNVELISNPNNVTRYYKPKAAGKYYFAYGVKYSQSCKFAVLDSVVVGYVPVINTAISCDGNQFEVTLINNSSYYDDFVNQTNVSYSIINLGSGTPESLNSYNNDEALATLNPGDYELKLELSRPGYPTCEITDTVHLSLPDPSFSLTKSQYCVEENVVLSPDYIDSENNYTWHFQNASNKTGPLMNFNSPILTPYLRAMTGTDITLDVENAYGCIKSETHTVDILEANFDGRITPKDPLICPDGGSIELSYTLTNQATQQPSGYQWFYKTNPIPGAVQKDYTATAEGYYYVYLFDQNGCVDKTTEGAYVGIADRPEVRVKAKKRICEGQQFTISGTVSPETAEYEILSQGNVVQSAGSGPEVYFSTLLSSPGTYDYTLKFWDPATGCEDSKTFSVEVFPHLEIEAEYELISCEPYRYRLFVTNAPSGPGTFNWSNGEEGDDIIVDHGGRYQVTYQSGEMPCSATADIYVPQSPDKYMWIFPDGCYTYCFDNPDMPDKFIIGPIPKFDYYGWDIGGFTFPSGAGYVEDFGVSSQYGDLTMTLANDPCIVTSKPLHMQIGEGCEEECDIEWGDFEARSFSSGPFNAYEVYGALNTGFGGAPIKVVLQSQDGYFIPNHFMLSSGGYNFGANPPIFIPNNGFSGSSIDVKFIFYDGNNVICANEISIPLQVPYPYSVMPLAKLTVSPNPLTRQTEVGYDFEGLEDFKRGVLQLFSLEGLLLKEYQIDGPRGRKMLDLSEFASGGYIIILRNNDRPVGQQLIIKR